MLNLFEKIASETSPIVKVKLLLEYPHQSTLKDTLKAALDPFITYGITDFEVPPAGDASGESPYRVLKQLSKRELTGSRAREALGRSLADQPEEDHELFRRIIRKDLRCGVGVKLAIQAYPGLVREFSVMRAAKFKGYPSRGTYVIQPKYDGLRCLAVVYGSSVKLMSRNGNEFTSSDHLKTEILELVRGQGDCVLDGELVSGDFNQSSSSVRKKGSADESVNFHIFDFLDRHEWNNPIMEHHMRRRSLENLFQGGAFEHLILTPEYRVSSESDVFKYYHRFLDMGLEGGMLKKVTGLYRFKRHSDWLKLKEVNDVDLRVESLVQGEGKYYGQLGAVVVSHRGKKVRVGSGFSDTERELFWEDPSLILGKVIEVQYHMETPDGSLRHPRFNKVREDKS